MKKVWILLLTLCMLCTLAACGGKNAGGESQTPSSVASQGGFQKPSDYAAVLRISLNPQLNLYLAENGTVLAVEPLNEAAKQIASQIALNTDYKTAVGAFVAAAYTKGYIQADAKLYLEITEPTGEQVDATDVLDNAASAAASAAENKGISLEVERIDNGTPLPPAHIHAWKAATCKAPQTCADCGETQGTPMEHAWQPATCKAPETCPDCGETQGTPLEHEWQPATCKAPKTCLGCQTTEGGKGDHHYHNGVCEVCGDSPARNPQTDLQRYVEYIGNLEVSGNMLHGWVLSFEDELCIVVSRDYTSEPEEPDTPPAFEYRGTVYYSVGGGMEPYNCEITDTEILLKGCLWSDDPDSVTVKLILQGNGMLKVTESVSAYFPVDLVLSTNIYDVM